MIDCLFNNSTKILKCENKECDYRFIGKTDTVGRLKLKTKERIFHTQDCLMEFLTKTGKVSFTSLENRVNFSLLEREKGIKERKGEV